MSAPTRGIFVPKINYMSINQIGAGTADSPEAKPPNQEASGLFPTSTKSYTGHDELTRQGNIWWGGKRQLTAQFRHWESQAFRLTLLFVFFLSIYPQPAKAQQIETGGTTTLVMTQELAPLLPRTTTRKVWLTAYTSTPEETDDTPFITASGLPTGDGIAAANFLPFGTQFRVPKLFGNKVFTIQDRMHPRKVNFVDLWVTTKEQAYKIGIRQIDIEIILES